MSALRLVQLKEGIIYGPVKSRRLGRSLGINVLGAGRKICTFDCVYCQLRQARDYPVVYDCRTAVCQRNCADCEFTRPFAAEVSTPHEFPDVQTVLAAVEQALDEYTGLDSLTLSGNGEPTVHPHFLGLVEALAAMRDRRCPGTAITVLSNAASLWRPSVRAALRRVDRRVMKLDAGSDDSLRRANRPCPGTSVEEIVEGLEALGDVTVQTLFFTGEHGNAAPGQVEAWYRALVRVRPVAVQVYSLDRVPADQAVTVVPREQLLRIAEGARERTAADVTVY